MHLVGLDVVISPLEPTRQVVPSDGVRPVRLCTVQLILSHVVQGRGGVGRGGVDRNIGAVVGRIRGYPGHGSNFVWKVGSGLPTSCQDPRTQSAQSTIHNTRDWDGST